MGQNWKSIPVHQYHLLPGKDGRQYVYVLVAKDEAQYVGRSINMRGRLRACCHSGIAFVSYDFGAENVTIRYRPVHDARRREYRLIRRLDPRYNRTGRNPESIRAKGIP